MLTCAEIEAMREKVRKGEPRDEQQLYVMTQNPANHHHWSKSIMGVTQAQLVEILDLAAMAARIRER